MGIICSVGKYGVDQHGEDDWQDNDGNPTKLVKKSQNRPHEPLADRPHSYSTMDSNQYNLVPALDEAIKARAGKRELRKDAVPTVLERKVHVFRDADDYMRQRQEITGREKVLAFDHVCSTSASPLETKANSVIQAVRQVDQDLVYNAAEPRRGYGGQEHRRFMGDHFLYNADLIEQTKLFAIARKMPKGAHLHIHFNANLLPHVLIDIAKTMKRMFITSDIPLVPRDETAVGYYDGFDQCKIQFSIVPDGAEKANSGNLFDPDYRPRAYMKFDDFLKNFDMNYNKSRKSTADDWLKEKLVFHEEEAHGWLQTAKGAWEKFNGRTQMMKGLFNYETAYRTYTKLCLQEFVDDNIQYAEIRPNFMKANQLWTDDGEKQINNWGIMEIIIDEYKKFQRENPGAFLGLKVIYCAPRSFTNKLVEFTLNECLEFKIQWPEWIAGYDLVGEEGQNYPLKTFIPEFVQFKQKCLEAKQNIPFLFHCGETLEIGNDTDGNLVDALLLGAKRIGHGFALARHPYVMEQMKKRNMCLEVCPISNEILGLTPRINGHAMYNLLANNVHCTVSTDNGTLFRSRLSHDFYQVFAGKHDMTLHGWRQLIEWSIEHSCMEDKLRQDVYAAWETRWNKFCEWIIHEYGHLDPYEPSKEKKS